MQWLDKPTSVSDGEVAALGLKYPIKRRGGDTMGEMKRDSSRAPCAALYRGAALLLLGALFGACGEEAAPLIGSSTGAEGAPLSAPGAAGGEKADRLAATVLPANFPAAQDLAVLLPLSSTPIQIDLETKSGGALLPGRWLDAVEEAYEATVIEDALAIENYRDEWRVVSLRFAPCGPLGDHPGALPEGLCWPQIRIVWQPILDDFMTSWRRVDHYADDRAIHALYRVHPAGAGAESAPEALQSVRAALAAGVKAEALEPALLARFSAARDEAIAVLTAELHALRGGITSSLEKERERVSERIEFAELPALEHFELRLRRLLSDHCHDFLLDELTSFSLPEGRVPSILDRWVFIAFHGEGGEITQKEISLHARDDGRTLANLGLDQDVDQLGEDEELQEALERGGENAEAIRAQVVLSAEDRSALKESIADPQQTFVSNTTCASCHRLVDIRFDFHSFSYLEDHEATISPRVEADTENDLAILRRFLGQLKER